MRRLSLSPNRSGGSARARRDARWSLASGALLALGVGLAGCLNPRTDDLPSVVSDDQAAPAESFRDAVDGPALVPPSPAAPSGNVGSGSEPEPDAGAPSPSQGGTADAGETDAGAVSGPPSGGVLQREDGSFEPGETRR